MPNAHSFDKEMCVCVSNDLPWPAMEVDRVMGFLKGSCVFQNPPIVRLHDWRAALAPRGLCWHVRTCSGHSCYRESNHLLLGRAGGMGLSVANAKHQSQAADTNRSPEMRPFRAAISRVFGVPPASRHLLHLEFREPQADEGPVTFIRGMHGGISPSLDSLDNIRQLDRIQEAWQAHTRPPTHMARRESLQHPSTIVKPVRSGRCQAEC